MAMRATTIKRGINYDTKENMFDRPTDILSRDTFAHQDPREPIFEADKNDKDEKKL